MPLKNCGTLSNGRLNLLVRRLATKGQYHLFWPSLPELDPTRLLASAVTSGTQPIRPDPSLGAMALQLLPELWGSAMRDKNHGHDLLLCDVVEVTLIRDVQDSVRVCNHAFALFLRELEQLHSSRVQGVSLRYPCQDYVHT